MKRFLIALSVLFAVTIAAFAVFVITFDAESLKPYVEDAVYKTTGKKLGIDGTFDVKFGLSPKIVMTKVTLENMPNADDPYMATADSINLSLALLPLLKKELQIRELSLNGMSVNLYTDKDGRNNWSKTSDDGNQADKESVSKENAGKERFLKDIVFEKIDISDIGLSYVDERNAEMYQLFLKKFVLSGDKNQTKLEALINILSTDISVTADLSALSKVLSKTDDFNFSFTVNGFETSVIVKGTVRDALGGGTLQADVSAKTEKLRRVAALFGISLPNVNNLDLRAQITGTLKNPAVSEYNLSLGDEKTLLATVSGNVESLRPLKNAVANVVVNANNPADLVSGGVMFAPFVLTAKVFASENEFAVRDIVFSGGASDMTGSFSVSETDKISVAADFSSNRISLDELLVAVPARQPVPDIQANTVFMKKTKTSKVFSDEELPFELLNKINAVVTFRIKKLLAADKTDLGEVAFSATMQDGVFEIPDFNPANLFQGRFKLNAAEKPAVASVSLKAKNFPLPMFFLQQGVTSGNADINAALDTKGNSLAQMAENLNGEFFMFIKKPVFKNAVLANLKTILPPSGDFGNKDSVSADCFVVNLPVVNGLALSQQQIALQADGFDVQVNGEINLGTEKLALDIVTGVSKSDVLNALSGTLTVTGTLKTPQVKFNADNVMNKALSAGMAYLFSGKKAAQQYLESPGPANACRLAMEGGAPVKNVKGKKR